MPITLSQIATNTASVTLQVGSETVTVIYYPGHVTEKILTAANFDKRGDDVASIEAAVGDFNVTLANLIQSWDVLENDGETMFPIEASRFPDLPLAFRLQIFGAILGDLNPNSLAPQTQQIGK